MTAIKEIIEHAQQESKANYEKADKDLKEAIEQLKNCYDQAETLLILSKITKFVYERNEWLNGYHILTQTIQEQEKQQDAY